MQSSKIKIQKENLLIVSPIDYLKSKTIDNFDENLLEIFKVNEGKIGGVNAPFISDEFFSKLVIIGSWNENNPNDRNTVQTIMDEPYQVVEKKLQKLIVEKTPFVSLEEGIWKIKNRHQIFEGSVAYYFDNFLEVVFNEALNTYSQDSQKFNEKGEYSILVSSTSSYRNSSTLRNAFLKGVCMLANSNKLVNCTKNKLNNLEYKLQRTGRTDRFFYEYCKTKTGKTKEMPQIPS